MKLLFCPDCNDCFKLLSEPRQCKCGQSSGHYVDDINAEYSGKGIPIGFGNNSFEDAIKNQPHDGVLGHRFYAFVIPHHCATFRKVKSLKEPT